MNYWVKSNGNKIGAMEAIIFLGTQEITAPVALLIN